MKKIIKLILIFGCLGYIITYPYELWYSGTDEIKLISDSDSITSLSKVINHKEFKNKVLYIKIWEPFDDDSDNLSALRYKYRNKEIEFLYLSRPDSDSSHDIDELRKWKMALKRLKLKGNHILMWPKFYKSLWEDNPKMNKNFLPHFLIVNKQGEIVNFNAPSPDKAALLSELDQLLIN